MAATAKSRVLPMKAKNLAPKSRAGSNGYDVVIGPRKKHFATHAEAMNHALSQQNKGVHALFVIMDGATNTHERFTRAGKLISRGGKNPKGKGKSNPRDVSVGEKWEYSVRMRKGGKWRTIHKTATVKTVLSGQVAMSDGHVIFSGQPASGELVRRIATSKKNPESAAVAMREAFTGLPSKKTIVVSEDIHVHGHLAALGELVSMRVKTIKGETFDICFGKEENPKKRKTALSKVKGWVDRRGKAVTGAIQGLTDFWINPKRTNSGGVVLLCATEDGKNLAIECGSQVLDLKALNLGEFADKESVIIGEIKTIDYFATKDWKDGKNPETAIYTHKLSEETGGPLPYLRYDTISRKCYIDGGQYKINRPSNGSTSPGLEN